MSPRAERRAGRDDGFSLVEVVVALGIVMSLLVAVLPQLIGGIKATDLARRTSQAKSLASSELERMRNLPFHVSPNAGDFVDLFDRYFHDLAPATAPTCVRNGRYVPLADANSGYVTASAPRCDWEPDGAFYRVVRSNSGASPDPALDGFVVVVSTQFLTPSLDTQDRPQWRAPRDDYDTTEVGRDIPASAQVGVNVAVLGAQESDTSPVTTYSQIARDYQTQTQARATADASALSVGLTLPGATAADGNNISVTGALLHLDASLVASSRVEAAAAGLTASAGTGENAGTTRATATAPPNTALTFSSSTSDQLIGTECRVVCWGNGEAIGSWLPRTADGQPGIGRAGSPVGIALKTPSTGGYAIRVGMGTAPDFLPGLGLSNPLVRMRSGDVTSGVVGCTPSTASGNLRLHSAGWADVAAPATGVDACAVTHSAEVSLLPPNASNDDARVTIQLRSAYARCQVAGTTHTAQPPSVGYEVVLTVYAGGTVTDQRTLSYSSATGAVTGSLPSPASVGLGSYIDSWSVALPGDASGTRGITTVRQDEEVRAEIPAVMSILTKPLRQQRTATGLQFLDGVPVEDPQSAVAITLGSVSCAAEDHR